MSPALVALGCAAGAALGGVVAELGARAWLRRHGRPYVWAPFTRQRLEIDRAALPMLEPVARWEINADGERGAPLPHDWSRTLRVIVAGGSASECYFTDQPQTWPEVMRRALSRPENLRELGVDAVHVGNIARSLIACEEIDLIVERTLPRYTRLDVAVLMVGASDLIHWLERGTPVPVVDTQIPPSQVFALHPYGPFGWGPKTLALRRLASYWKRRLVPHEEVRTRVGKRLADARAMRARATTILHTTPDPQQMLAHYERHLRKVVARLQARGARVILARQAWLEGEFTEQEKALFWSFGRGRPYAGVVTEYFAHDTAWKLLRLVDAHGEKLARELGIESIDVNAIVPRDFDHYYDELHFTSRGCALVGEAIARVVAKPGAAAAPERGERTARTRAK